MIEFRMLNVLVINDNQDDISYFKELMQQTKRYHYLFTDTPRISDALDLLREDAYDLVLVSLNLLDSQPEETLDVLRFVHEEIGIPFVILASKDEHALAMRGVMNGATDYLLKDDHGPKLVSNILEHAVEFHHRSAA